MMVMAQPGCFCASARTIAEPTKPVPPEMSTFLDATILVFMVSRVVAEVVSDTRMCSGHRLAGTNLYQPRDTRPVTRAICVTYSG